MDRKKRYIKFLNSNEWKHIRLRLFGERGRKCEMCGETQNLHVHHLTYKRFGGKELNEDLQVLCDICHMTVHSKKSKPAKPNKRRYKNKNPVGVKKQNKEYRQKLMPICKKLILEHYDDGTNIDRFGWQKLAKFVYTKTGERGVRNDKPKYAMFYLRDHFNL